MSRRITPEVRAIAVLALALGAQGCNLLAGLDDVKFEGTGGGGGTTSAQGGGGSAGGTTSSTETTGAGGTTSSTETTSSSSTTTNETTTSSTTSTTTTTTATGPVVACNYPMVSNCDPGQVCCFDKSDTMPVDFCGTPGSCQPSTKYAELACENDDDCPGEVCCMYFVLGPNLDHQWQASYCDTACEDAQELPTCQSDADCTFPTPCKPAFSSSYPSYKACFQ